MSTAFRLIETRNGDGTDLPAVAILMSEAFDPRYGEAWSKGQCLGMLSLPGVWLTLAELDGRVAGFALARVVAGDGELLLLAVRPQARRKGVGAVLLRSVIADARARSAGRMHLEVRAGNPAVDLYLGHGFQKVGERRAYYRGATGRQHDAHTYALGLG